MNSRLPLFETERLILREINLDDCFDMYEYAKLPYIGPNAGWEPHTSISYTKEVIKTFNKKPQYGQLGVFAIVLKENNKMIGTCELHSYFKDFKAELGYTINPLYWNQGFATEASIPLLYWGFNDLNLKRIECFSFTDNLASRKVAEHLGFKFEGIRRKGYKLYNGFIGDLYCTSMTNDDFKELYK